MYIDNLTRKAIPGYSSGTAPRYEKPFFKKFVSLVCIGFFRMKFSVITS